MRTETQVKEKIENLTKQMNELKNEHQTEINKLKQNFTKNTPDHMAAISNFYQRRISVISDKISILMWVIEKNQNEQLLS